MKTICRAINADCPDDASGCPSFCSGQPCWATNDVSCCHRNDKSRCCYCSVYLNFVVWKKTGLLFRTKQESLEDEGFNRISKIVCGFAKGGQFSELRRQLSATVA